MPDFYIGEGQIGDAQIGSPTDTIVVVGKTAIGGSILGIVRWWSCKFNVPSSGVVIDMSCYFSMTGPGSYKFCVWDDDGAGNPGALLFQSSSDSHGTTAALKTLATVFSITSGDKHLGVIADDWMNIYTDSGSTDQLTEFNEDYLGWPTPPNPPTVLAQYSTEVTISLRYTPSGAPPTDTNKILMFF